MFRLLMILALLPVLTGCLITDTAVTNPVPEISTIAVAPFINTSMERGVDGRRFANVYFTELQKIPGFEVVPVGVVETAMAEKSIEMRGPADAVRLAEILNVDAVVVGTVTEYDSYAPPRIGLKVSWYSSQQQKFLPGIPIDPLARERQRNEQELREIALREANRRPLQTSCCDGGCGCEGECDGSCNNCLECDHCRQNGCNNGFCPNCDSDSPLWWRRLKNELKDPLELHKGPRPYKHRIPVPWPSVRAQSPEEKPVQAVATQAEAIPFGHSVQMAANQPMNLPAENWPPASPMNEYQIQEEKSFHAPEGITGPMMNSPQGFMPLEVRPFMEYARMFDARDPEVAAKFRDYLELSGQVQTGDWESYLHRSDDYIQFVTNVMIEEMLRLHGGESRRRIIFTKRKYSH